MKKYYLFAILFITIVSCKKKDSPVIPKSDWTIYTSANSSLYPNYGIETLFIDKSGVLWINSNGLARYDGSSWSYFDQSNTGILISGVENGIKTNNGINWFGSEVGLIKFQNNNWSLYNMQNTSLPSSGVVGVTTDLQNNIWLATENGIVKYDGVNSWVIYNSDNTPITCNYAKFIKSTSNGTIWAGIVLNTVVCPSATTGCLARLQNNNWTIFTSINSNLPTGDIQALEIDRNGIVWLAIGGKILKYNGVGFDIFDSSNSILPSNTLIDDIAFDNQNNLWATSQLNGVFKFDGTNWKNFTTQNSQLPDNWITSVAIDNNNNKWFGCLTAKVVKYTGN